MRQTIDEILDKIPDEFNIRDMSARAEERTPFTTVVFQECLRMNSLMLEIRSSLNKLNLGLKVSSFRNIALRVEKLNIKLLCLIGRTSNHTRYGGFGGSDLSRKSAKNLGSEGVSLIAGTVCLVFRSPMSFEGIGSLGRRFLRMK